MKINILDKTIFNRIAAGEVVEKPASVVKELVENSVDAGATNITIEVENGGIKKIKVIDNGCGMSKDDLPRAFMPHATSKIANLADLEQIGTLGFRGEALSSIASVAKVVAIACEYGADLGSKIEIHGGEVISLTEYGASQGCQIIIEDLFYNVPARAKFLKKPKSEEGEVTNIVSRLIMANPNVAIKYVVEGKIIFISNGSGLQDAIYAVYGKTTSSNLLQVNHKEEFYKVSGYIGIPSFSKANRTYQTLIINGRYVVNSAISAAASKAYEGFLMKGVFPFYVLHLNVPLDKVDINVHPNKLDVKFEDSNKVFSIILKAISNALFKTSHIKEITTEELLPADITKLNTVEGGYEFNLLDSMPNISNVVVGNPNHKYHAEPTSTPGHYKLPNNTNYENMPLPLVQEPPKDQTFTGVKPQPEQEEYITQRETIDFFLNNSDDEFFLKTDKGLAHKLAIKTIKNGKLEESNIAMFNTVPLKIIGTIFATYIIAESGSNIYFIDQHAAHERILYDQLKQQLAEKEILSQSLLVPHVINTNAQETLFINDNIKSFKELGFEIESFGMNDFKVAAVPLLFKNFNIADFFNKVLADIKTSLKINTTDIMEDYLAKVACRAAIKANDVIENSEIEEMIAQMNKNNTILLCPHGRPIVIKITKNELEKFFKRIV